MAIPDSQLETWVHQGAVATSRDTYAIVKRALESSSANYSKRNYQVFLQGSYGNDTNTFAESDVDIVICCSDVFYKDLDNLDTLQKNAFNAHFSDGSYPYDTFKTEVQTALVAAFGSAVQPPNRAFKIAPAGTRRSADVVAAFQHRRYLKFNGPSDELHLEGITFFNAANTRINNFPKQHSQNLTAKHQATGNRFKPAIRIFKNVRSRLVDDGHIEKGEGPSYFIEGLLYNVPNEKFTGSLSETVLGILTWLSKTTDRSQFTCANGMYYLLRDNDPVCWPPSNGAKFIAAAINLWNNWRAKPRARLI